MYICNNPDGFLLQSCVYHKRTQCIHLSRYQPEWGQSPFGPCKVYRILIIMLVMRQKDLSSVYM